MRYAKEGGKVYADSLIYIQQCLADLRQDKTVEGNEVEMLAKIFVDELEKDKDALMFRANMNGYYKDWNKYLHVHSVNVSILAISLGKKLGYTRDELVDLCSSAILHDIGMIKIPMEIISKPSKLTEKEYDLVKKHPKYGIELLNNIKNPPKTAFEVVYQHHERIDGTGYPERKKGEEISEYAQIVAIVEIFEAMSHSRPYHRNIPTFVAMKKLIQESNGFFRPELIKHFLNNITPYPVGSIVLLNNSEIGCVIKTTDKFPIRPIVEVIRDAEGKRPEIWKTIDLTEDPRFHIKRVLDEDEF